MSIDLSQFYQVFFEEAAEHLGTMESLLLKLDVAHPAMDDLNAIFRAAHSIKGGAGTFGFTDMTEVTHVLETLLDKLRKEEMQLTDEMVNAFLQAGDVISSQLAAHRGEGAVDQAEVAAVREKLERLSAAQPAAVQGAGQQANKQQALPRESAAVAEDPGYGFFGDDTEHKADASHRGGEDTGYGFFGELPQDTARKEQEQGYGFFQEIAAPVAEKSAASAQPVAAAPVAKVAPAAASEASSIRVNVEKVDQLINLVGELVITQAMLAQTVSHLDPVQHENLHNSMAQLERNTRGLQEAVMSIRMMPMSFVFSRFPRVVRDLAGKLNKQVELKTVGEATELDKGLIEKIADPLTHLVRNSLDHGIESPEVRIAAGKPAKGTITLRAEHQGGNIVIEVIDDGAGLNREKILAKAREKNIQVSDAMSDQEVWLLIFAPGFSTAAVVTDVSGRGVGMDVVKRNISEMGGRVEIESVMGAGTRMTIRLPLTLAILDGMSVALGNEIYILPLSSVTESLQPSPEDIKTISDQGKVLHVRGEYVSLVALHEVFNAKPRTTKPEEGILVLLEAEGKKIALLVDELVGQHQVVIKSLESNYRRVRGVSGATIMGDGRVALILDVAALIRLAQQAMQ